jgi:hypothetical protein
MEALWNSTDALLGLSAVKAEELSTLQVCLRDKWPREFLVPSGLYSHSLTHLVVALRVLELLDVFWQQLRPIDFDCQLVELEHV